MKFTVCKDITSDFKTITEVLKYIKNNRNNKNKIEIFVKNGIYEEQIEILEDNISIIGESCDNTIIKSSFGAKELLCDGSKRGTFNTATVRTYGKNIILRNLSIYNEAGDGKIVGQAVALYTDGDNICVENCNIIANQDTIFTGPLPQCNIDGTTTGMGPRGDFPRTSGRHYFKKCYIEGDIDFIFGGAMALFEECTIFSHDKEGYITAASTPEKQQYGYLFLKCKILGQKNKDAKVYLGRPWRNNAKTVFINCQIDSHVKEELWHDWNKIDAHKTTFYAIDNQTLENFAYNSSAEKILKKIAPWSKVLTNEQGADYTKEFLKVFFDKKTLFF